MWPGDERAVCSVMILVLQHERLDLPLAHDSRSSWKNLELGEAVKVRKYGLIRAHLRHQCLRGGGGFGRAVPRPEIRGAPVLDAGSRRRHGLQILEHFR